MPEQLPPWDEEVLRYLGARETSWKERGTAVLPAHTAPR